nr:hypothetical protein [Tanacetum cinerariifolium]
MVDVNVNAPADQAPTMAPPTRTDDQILPHIRWRKYRFYPRPDSPLHLPNEKPGLRYLKFIAKGTKREVFEIPIPDNLITANIQGEPYFKEYLEKVTKHQTYLGDEKGSAPNSPAPKPAKATKKSKPSVPKVDLRPPEPRFDDEEVDVQRALEESLKSIYDAPWGPLPPGVIREPERTSTSTGSSGHDESSSLYAKLGLTNSEVESDEDVPGIDAGVQEEGQVGPNLGEQDEG